MSKATLASLTTSYIRSGTERDRARLEDWLYGAENTTSQVCYWVARCLEIQRKSHTDPSDLVAEAVRRAVRRGEVLV